MKFELNDYNRNVSDEDLLQDIVRVADLLQTDTLSHKVYVSHGKYHSSTIIRRFGTWASAMEKAGIRASQTYNRNPHNIDVSDEQLLHDVKETANRLGLNTLSSIQYSEHGKHGHSIIIYRFGTWDNALSMAGLEPTGIHHFIPTEDLFEEIERIWIMLGRQPTSTDIRNGISKYSLHSYTGRFGGWRNALQAFVDYINVESDTSQAQPVKEEPKNIVPTTKKVTPSRKTSRDINLRLRFMVMRRDNFKCCACGASPAKSPGVELHIDHIIPWSKGGETTMENLQTLCSKCNLGKSDIL